MAPISKGFGLGSSLPHWNVFFLNRKGSLQLIARKYAGAKVAYKPIHHSMYVTAPAITANAQIIAAAERCRFLLFILLTELLPKFLEGV